MLPFRPIATSSAAATLLTSPARKKCHQAAWLAAAIILCGGVPAMAQQQPANNNLPAAKAPAKAPKKTAAKVAASTAAPASPEEHVVRGREMFARKWKLGDAKTPAGDGLGPMYNAQSFAECHSTGGVGGSGDLKHNVDLLSLIPPSNKKGIDRQEFADHIEAVHPAFTAGGSGAVLPTIPFHKSSTNDGYAKWREGIVTLTRSRRLASAAASENVGFQITQRRAPALFGAGRIDGIPVEVLARVAAEQAKRHDGIHGVVALATDGGVGKFGWRGQTATLKEFVVGACANELGLSSPGANEPMDPLDPKYTSPGLDLTNEQCNDLVAYVASLPPPVQREPSGYIQSTAWRAGGKTFNALGCATCHVQELGGVAGIYSDLLLHDMGQQLYDPAGPNSPRSTVPNRTGSGPYYGGPDDVLVDLPTAPKRQWRTPPLWGIAASGPYLHDGRAPTLQDAILEHGGEADGARKAYLRLPKKDRADLLSFLQSLGAPDENDED